MSTAQAHNVCHMIDDYFYLLHLIKCVCLPAVALPVSVAVMIKSRGKTVGRLSSAHT